MTMVYISGPLTNLSKDSNQRYFYELVGELCNKLGLMSYIPHLKTDPVRFPNISASEVFTNDKREVIKSDLVIAYVGIPSLGVGMELAYAEANNIPIILLYKNLDSVSRFVLGIPTVIKAITFDEYEEALTKLNKCLKRYIINSSIKSS